MSFSLAFLHLIWICYSKLISPATPLVVISLDLGRHICGIELKTKEHNNSEGSCSKLFQKSGENVNKNVQGIVIVNNHTPLETSIKNGSCT